MGLQLQPQDLLRVGLRCGMRVRPVYWRSAIDLPLKSAVSMETVQTSLIVLICKPWFLLPCTPGGHFRAREAAGSHFSLESLSCDRLAGTVWGDGKKTSSKRWDLFPLKEDVQESPSAPAAGLSCRPLIPTCERYSEASHQPSTDLSLEMVLP